MGNTHAKTYEGTPCIAHGHTTRYASNGQCRPCKLANRQKLHTANRARDLDDYKRFRRTNPTYNRAFELRKKYGISLEDYDALAAAQGERCAICGGASTRRKHFDVDHNHSTGKVRGLLCNSCNLGIGKFRDDPTLLERAAEYLTSYAREAEHAG